MKYIIFGPPSSGKGTYASRIAPKLGIVHITTGELLRAVARENSPLAQEIQGYMQKGDLVPDKLVVELLKKELEKPEAKHGFILDGFPRNLEQVKILEGITSINAILSIKMPSEILIEKLSARRQCRDCGNIYNVADIQKDIDGIKYNLPPMLPKVKGTCDKCGGKIYQRTDDNIKTVTKRLETYEVQSKPVLDYYQGKVPFIEILPNEAPDTVVEKTMEKIRTAGLDK